MAQVIGLLAFSITVPIAGSLSDRYGRKVVMLTFLAPYALLIYPLFAWVQLAPVFYTLAGSVLGLIGCLLLLPAAKIELGGAVLKGKAAA